MCINIFFITLQKVTFIKNNIKTYSCKQPSYQVTINVSYNTQIKEIIQNLFQPMTQQPTEICDNCLKPFPESKIATHFGYCRRNIKKCLKCGEMYDINFQEQHQEEFHKMGSCKYCKKQFKPNEISKHQDNCESRTKYCEYCDLDVPMKDYPSHLRQCQARTKQCEKCRKPIANKDFLIHQISCPGFVQEVKPSISSNNQYSDYQNYLKEQKRKDQIRTNEYKPSYQQPKRQSSRQREVRPQQVYSNNIYTSNNGVKYAEIKKEAIIPNKPATYQTKPSTNYADIKMNKNAVNYGDQKIPSNNIYEKDLKPKVQVNSNKYIESNRNIGSGKIIQNKYAPSNIHQTKPTEYKPSIPTYGLNKDGPKTVITASSNARTYQPPQIDVNNKPSQNLPSSNYPKVQQAYKKQIPSSKDVLYSRREEKPKETPYRNPTYETRREEARRQEPRREEPRREEPRRYNEPQRNMPRTNVVQHHQYNSYESYQPSSYQVPQQHTYQTPIVNDHEMDEELQRAIMASLGGMAISSPKQQSHKQSKPSYKIDEAPVQLLQQDMMNESFYGKQQAIWEEFEKNKNKRR